MLRSTGVSIFGLFAYYDVYQRFTCVALYHSILVSDRLDGGSRSRFSRLSCHPEGSGYIVPKASHPAVTSGARFGRILMAEHQVVF